MLIKNGKINRVVKIFFTIWMLAWAPSFGIYYGPSHFLWLCNITNFLVLVALWREDSLIFSSQIVLTLLIDSLWVIDLACALALNVHPFGATTYMFDPALHLAIRLMSLYHLFLVPLIIYGLWCVGYDNRGWKLQTVITAVAYPLTYLFGDPAGNINWLWYPFGIKQTVVSLEVFVVILMAAFPLMLYLPTHGLIRLWLFFKGKRKL